jgi:hypothetical protein
MSHRKSEAPAGDVTMEVDGEGDVEGETKEQKKARKEAKKQVSLPSYDLYALDAILMKATCIHRPRLSQNRRPSSLPRPPLYPRPPLP